MHDGIIAKEPVPSPLFGFSATTSCRGAAYLAGRFPGDVTGHFSV